MGEMDVERLVGEEQQGHAIVALGAMEHRDPLRKPNETSARRMQQDITLTSKWIRF
jgi:hypothetical protein